MCPPCSTIRISPDTCSCVLATNASSAVFSGEYHSRRTPARPTAGRCPLEPAQFALQRDVLELGVRGDEHHRAWGLIDLAALDADQPVLDHVEPAHALRTGPPVQLDDRFQDGRRAPVYGYRHALGEADDDLVG
jgi:hypothetical protein